MVTIKDGCGCDPCDCDWKQKLKEAYSRAIQSVNKIGDNDGSVYFPDGTGFVKLPLPTKEQIDSIAEIDGIKASVDNLNVTVPALEAQVTGVTGSLVSDVEVLNGTTAGKFKVRIKREKASLIDSNDYDLSKVNSIELIQGSGPAMVKAQLTLSDGTVLRSDDFLFTSESIGTDVYISSFTFKNGNVDGTISADIGLNNGTTLEANNFVVPTDPSVVSTITDLQTRTEALEQNVTDINNKADLNNVNQVIIAKQIDLESIVRIKGHNEANTEFVKYGIVGGKPSNPFTVTQETEAFGQIVDKPIATIALLNTDGTPKNFTGGGESWEELDVTNLPLDWKVGDRLRISLKAYYDGTILDGSGFSPIIEFIMSDEMSSITPYAINPTFIISTVQVNTISVFNNGRSTDFIFILGKLQSGDSHSNGAFQRNMLTANKIKMWRLKK